jgi:hypothetical protein
MFSIFRKRQTVESTPFSEFIRKASSEEKKRVYSQVLKRASEAQTKMIAKTSSCKVTG